MSGPAVAGPPAPPAGPAGDAPLRMGSVAKHVMVYGAGVVLGRAVSFIMLPVYTSFLTPADYGVIQLIEMTLDMIAIVAGGQIAAGIFRYYHAAPTEGERKAVVSTALWLLAGSYTAVGAVTFVAAPALSDLIFGSPGHAALIRLAAGSLGLSSLVVAPLAYLRVQERSSVFVTVNVVKLVLSVSLNVLFLVGMEMGPAAIFLSSFLANLIIGGVLATMAVREMGLHFSTDASRKLLRYGLPLIATQIATFATTFGDRYFLQAAGNEAIVGLYGLAYQFGFLLALIGCTPFEMIWDPTRFRVAKQPNRDEVLARGFIYLNVLLISTAVGITLFVGDVLRIMTTPAFHSAAAIVPVILVAYVFQSWAGTQDIGIRIRDRTEFLTLANWIAAAAALVGYAVLVPRYLGWGAAAATAVAFALRYGMIFFISQRLWPVRYRWGPVLRILLLGLAVSAAGLLLPPLRLHVALPIRGTLLTLYFIGLWNLGILSPGDRQKVRSVLALLPRRLTAAPVPTGRS